MRGGHGSIVLDISDAILGDRMAGGWVAPWGTLRRTR